MSTYDCCHRFWHSGNMAGRHGDSSYGDIEPFLSSTSYSDQNNVSKSTANDKYDASIIEKNLKLAWIGDFQSVKCMVAEYLEIDGWWDSPGGEKKVFYSGDIPTISWWNKKKLIQIDGVNAMAIKRKLLSANVLSYENIGSERATPRLNEASDAMSSAMETCGCTCNCSGKVSTADMEGLKLDMTILESRLNSVGSCNALNSELNSLKSKQQAMEAIICKHEEIICNLNDDNTFFKAKLMSFVEQTPIVTYSNHVKNVNNADCSVGTTNTEHGFGDRHTDSNIDANELRLNNGGAIAEDIMTPQVVYVANDSVITDNPNHEDNPDNAISDGIVHPSDKNKITYAK